MSTPDTASAVSVGWTVSVEARLLNRAAILGSSSIKHAAMQ